MSTPALAAALADIDTVFNGFSSPTETGCERCFAPQETAYLRTPYTRVPPDLLRRFVHKVPGHFEDHAAVMRRLLPQCARAMADGGLDDLGWSPHGLSRVDWRSWPAGQAAAVEAFVLAWWDDVLTSPEPPYRVQDVFETGASILRTMTPLLDRWQAHPVADTHLVDCARDWLCTLSSDHWPFIWWTRDDESAGVAELRAWLARHAPDRLRARGEPDLATRARLVGLPYEERWNDPYWTNPSATS
ncbi:hypothetical protein ACIRU3_32010 [Streptomyces sp. NPDC101151]|uniref:hypothetical protein n=1 Tax=Streptomyces sp. NPDC101151 TaxID=3366115 RepID=UPI00381CF7B2